MPDDGDHALPNPDRDEGFAEDAATAATAAAAVKTVNTADAAADTAQGPATMPHRDPSPAPRPPSPTQSSAASPHAVLHEGDDQYPDPRDRSQDNQQYPGIIPADSEYEPEEDEFDLNEGYETGSTGSTSVTSSVYAHTFENGRRYQHFKNGRYPIPNDDEELNREDMKHAMLMELCDGQLFYAPIGDQPHMILDIGTGTGKSRTPPSYVSSQPSVLTSHTIHQVSGRLRLATSTPTRVSVVSTYRLRSPSGYHQMLISSSMTASRASG